MEYKISMAQIDPNGLCNSGCWFCPVAYSPNPEFAKKDMPIETLNNILSQLSEGKGKFVSESFDFVYTAHYNEVLLYKYFEEMLGLFRCYGLRTIILTNGTPLTRNKIDIIKKYPDVVYGICLNIPESDPALWSKATGKPESMFPKLINNIKYAIEQLPDMFKEKRMSIQVNGMNQFSLSQYGGWLDMLPNAPEINLDPEKGTLASSVKGFKKLFPDLQIYEMPHLIDRAGHLDKQKVITNINGIKNHAKKDKLKVIGCGNGIEVGGRPNGWIHINANGDMFICCNDYDFETIFGNINEKTIDEIWMSKEHKDMIEKSYNSLCMTCAAAIWG